MQVTQRKLIREMDVSELIAEYDRVKSEYLKVYSNTIDFEATSKAVDARREIEKQYTQLTGKSINQN